MDLISSREKVFKDASITPDQVEALIDAVCDVLNSVLEEFRCPNRIAGGERNQRSVQFLLETLRPNSVNASDDA